jgi:hypothetical protein
MQEPMTKTRFHRLSLAAFVAAAPIFLTACAGVDQRMTLTYDASRASYKAEGPVIYVLSPVEAHGVPTNEAGMHIMGHVVNQSGDRTADVLCQDDLGAWAWRGIAGEMRAAGFNTSMNQAAPKGVSSVASEIAEISTQTRSRWSSNEVKARVRVTFTVTKDGEAAGSFESLGEGEVDKAGKLPDNMRLALEKALKDCVNKALPELRQRLGK